MALLLALAAITIAFVWVVLQPFASAIFWAVVLAILFTPLYRWLLQLTRKRRTTAALLTLLAICTLVGIPLVLIASSLLGQAAGVYADVASGRLDFGAFLLRIAAGLPPWAVAALDQLGVGDLAALQAKVAALSMAVARFLATQMFSFGLDTANFAISLLVMLYLLFFLLRDGASLAKRILDPIPLASEVKQDLAAMLVTVVRATIRGGVLMAAAQGVLGGLMLTWLGIQGPTFWGVVFGLLSMLPAVGASLLWAPIAIYFIFTGTVWKGVVLILFGTVVLTLVDNILRPILVGRDTDLPGYLILLSTLGGIATFGLSGVVVGPLIAATFMGTWRIFYAPETTPQAGA
jgi:predicted PurR-regulated permease PerM